MIVQPLGPKELIDMDASGSFGLGAINYITKEFFFLPPPAIVAGLPIHVGEMAVLMLGIDTWAGPTRGELSGEEPNLCSKHLDLYSDNQAVVASINFGRSQEDFLAMGTCYVHYQMALRDSTLTLTYVSTKENIFADNLSRDWAETVHFLQSRQLYFRVLSMEGMCTQAYKQ